MNKATRNALYSVILLFIVALIYLFREAQRPVMMEFQGETMGTTYSIKYLDSKSKRLKSSIDSLLAEFNNSLSTYIPNSEISRFNKDSLLVFKLPFFYPVLQKSKEIHQASLGYFDPTVGPLVNAWGFGFKKEQFPDSARIDSLMQVVGFDKITFNEKQVAKKTPNIILDFSAIAKGYGVDIVAQFLESKNIKNYMVEIGGEVVCKGVNQEEKPWQIGINKPVLRQETQAIVALSNRAMASSGNYRRFYMRGNKKYAHTLDPHSGYPVQHSLLAVSVFAEDCITADAFATAFMSMGMEKAKEIMNKTNSLDAFFIFSDENGNLKTEATAGISKSINE